MSDGDRVPIMILLRRVGCGPYLSLVQSVSADIVAPHWPVLRRDRPRDPRSGDRPRAGRRFLVEQVRNPLREEPGFAHVGAHQAPGARGVTAQDRVDDLEVIL